MAPAFILFCQPRDPIIEKSAHLNPAAIITSDFPAYVRDIPSIFEQNTNVVHTGTAAVNKFIAVHSPPPPKARARLAAIKTKVEEPVKQEPVKQEPVEAVIKEEPVEAVIDKIVAIPTSVVEKPVEEKPVEDKPVEEKPVEDKPVEEKKPARKTVKRTVKKKPTDTPAQ